MSSVQVNSQTMPTDELKRLEAEGSPRPFAIMFQDLTLRDANQEIVATFHSRSDLIYAAAAFNSFTNASELLDWLNTELAKRGPHGEHVKVPEHYCDHVFEAIADPLWMPSPHKHESVPMQARCQKCSFMPVPVQINRQLAGAE